jgi:GNAT superfamily N-acetyltransferase
MHVVKAIEPDQIEMTRTLFREYADTVQFVECFQDFGTELSNLPGEYGPPSGSLLLARDGDEPVGCVGLRPIGDGVCEMKRLFVRPASRGRGIGRLLAERIIAEARAIGYERMRLDTLPEMREARGIYEQFGFRTIEPYREYRIGDVLFFEMEL